MYDFWYALGGATIYPKLLDAIEHAHPVFNFVPRINVFLPSGAPGFVRKGPGTGLLDNTATTNVRLHIAEFLDKHFDSAPPVGIYTAGRFCQLIKIPLFDSTNECSSFRDIIDLAHGAYREATCETSPKSPAFPALLGLLMADDNVVQAILNLAPGDPVEEILDEFDVEVGSSDYGIVLGFIGSSEFQRAVKLFMGGDSNPWAETGNTLEQAMFWDTVSQYAIP